MYKRKHREIIILIVSCKNYEVIQQQNLLYYNVYKEKILLPKKKKITNSYWKVWTIFLPQNIKF